MFRSTSGQTLCPLYRVFEVFEICRHRKHVGILLRKEFVFQVKVVVVSVFEILVTPYLRPSETFLIEERCHLYERRSGDGAGKRKSQHAFPCHVIFHVYGREEVECIQISGEIFHIIVVVHALAAGLYAESSIQIPSVAEFEISLYESRSYDVRSIVLVPVELAAVHGYQPVLQISEVQVCIWILEIRHRIIDVSHIIVESGGAELTDLVFGRKAETDLVVIIYIVCRLDIGHEFVFAEFSEISLGLLLVQFEEIPPVIGSAAVHDLPSVRFVTGRHGIGSAPVYKPACRFMMS